MNPEMMQKVEEMFLSGKITLEQKELLLKALEHKDQQDSDNIKITTVLDTDKKELQVKLLNEDLIVQGDREATQVGIINGSELVEVIKSENKILIQSKKENLSFIGNIIKSHEIITKKNGVLIQPRSSDDKVVIVMPASMISSLKTVSGDIELSNVQSEISIKSVSGDIEVKNQIGAANLSTISGDINIDNHKGQVEIVSKSGDINIEDCEIKGLIKTYSGDICIDDGFIQDLEMAVFSGDIEIRNAKADGEIQCKTFSGDISAKLQAQSAFVNGVTASGELFFRDANHTEHDITNKEIGDSSESLRIRIRTTSGDGNIQLEKRQG